MSDNGSTSLKDLKVTKAVIEDQSLGYADLISKFGLDKAKKMVEDFRRQVERSDEEEKSVVEKAVTAADVASIRHLFEQLTAAVQQVKQIEQVKSLMEEAARERPPIVIRIAGSNDIVVPMDGERAVIHLHMPAAIVNLTTPEQPAPIVNVTPQLAAPVIEFKPEFRPEFKPEFNPEFNPEFRPEIAPPVVQTLLVKTERIWIEFERDKEGRAKGATGTKVIEYTNE